MPKHAIRSTAAPGQLWRPNRLLAKLPAAADLLVMPYLKEISLERGAILRDSGDPLTEVYFPHGGMVSIVVVMPDGEVVETANIGFEGVIGATAAFGSQAAFGRAIVQLPGRASCISANRFHAAAEQNSAWRDLMLRYNEMMLAQTQQTAACNILHEVQGRFCRWLLEAQDRVGGDDIPLTQELIAAMLGVRRTTVTLAAHSLQEIGLIKFRRGHVRIINRAAIEERACGCYRIIRNLQEEIGGI
jgi:CRP-like cAMP-binding protein